jgi:hypothetical protein
MTRTEYYRFNRQNIEKLLDIFDEAINTTIATSLKKKIE